MKRCPRCQEEKALSDFYPDPKRGTRTYCKSCDKASARQWREENLDRAKAKLRIANRRYHYGMSEDEYQALLAVQGGVCAVCLQPETTVTYGKVRHLSVDHDHRTGRPRGLLCNKCNRGIGNLMDDPALLRAAAAYLELHADDPGRPTPDTHAPARGGASR